MWTPYVNQPYAALRRTPEQRRAEWLAGRSTALAIDVGPDPWDVDVNAERVDRVLLREGADLDAFARAYGWKSWSDVLADAHPSRNPCQEAPGRLDTAFDLAKRFGLAQELAERVHRARM